MSNVRKSVLQFVVYHTDDDKLENYTLLDILDECDTGNMIRGSVDTVLSELVPDESLKSELIAIGNDGTFFDYPNEETD
ncbi:hypothetical protein [Xanthomonas phage XacN1]|nr:hypothetical protein [Xanthomonas phage XacN1]BBA65638.1 hypothetical protein [Xanthomonas phage XacN1]